MLYNTTILLVLLVYWMALIGHATITSTIIGIAVSAAIVKFMYRIIKISSKSYANQKKFRPQLKISFYIFLYIPWLLWQIILSSLKVATLIWRKASINPMIIETKPNSKTNLGITMLSNSITLTPGTISIVEQGISKIRIHALDINSTADAIKELDKFNLQIMRVTGTKQKNKKISKFN
ncbi:multicomponent Na+:H+ antiporter subunit E [Candidatus Xenohaliotis californiensis]|uniref:Multicomponent Na+:H+ antiporter subunit E n=1 Tax=Candidatus Xenohaliotis californiensis TaxID=84677 RepID=A0ABM9N837_9RICK|nr:multicomponent Na+:H+ antiporter subunit E [Candidatus Xenohaliotis californiensis]